MAATLKCPACYLAQPIGSAECRRSDCDNHAPDMFVRYNGTERCVGFFAAESYNLNLVEILDHVPKTKDLHESYASPAEPQQKATSTGTGIDSSKESTLAMPQSSKTEQERTTTPKSGAASLKHRKKETTHPGQTKRAPGNINPTQDKRKLPASAGVAPSPGAEPPSAARLPTAWHKVGTESRKKVGGDPTASSISGHVLPPSQEPMEATRSNATKPDEWWEPVSAGGGPLSGIQAASSSAMSRPAIWQGLPLPKEGSSAVSGQSKADQTLPCAARNVRDRRTREEQEQTRLEWLKLAMEDHGTTPRGREYWNVYDPDLPKWAAPGDQFEDAEGVKFTVMLASRKGEECVKCRALYPREPKRARGHTLAQHGVKVRQYFRNIGTQTPKYDSRAGRADSNVGRYGDNRVRMIGQILRPPDVEYIPKFIYDEQEQEHFAKLLRNDRREFARGLRSTWLRHERNFLSLKPKMWEEHDWATLSSIRHDLNEELSKYREIVRIYRDVAANMPESPSFANQTHEALGNIEMGQSAARSSKPEEEPASTEHDAGAAREASRSSPERQDSTQEASTTVKKKDEKLSFLGRLITRPRSFISGKKF